MPAAEGPRGSRIRVRCVCGWEAIDEPDGAVNAAIEHGQRIHNMTATRDTVMATAEWAEPPGNPGDQA